jgi:hypothetical protein
VGGCLSTLNGVEVYYTVEDFEQDAYNGRIHQECDVIALVGLSPEDPVEHSFIVSALFLKGCGVFFLLFNSSPLDAFFSYILTIQNMLLLKWCI